MPESSPLDITDPISANPAYMGNPAVFRSRTADDPDRKCWPSIFGRIILAGGLYPIILGAGTLFIRICLVLFDGTYGVGLVWDTFFPLMVTAPIFVLFAGAAGILWAGIVATLVLPIFRLFAWSLKLRVGPVWLGGFSGGLVGFLAVLPFMLHVPHLLGASQTLAAFTMLAVGPGITIPLGQMGGALGGLRARQHAAMKAKMHRNLVAIDWRAGNDPTPTTADSSQDEAPPRFQFRIYHMLWIGVWLSLLLTVIRLSGIPYEYILPLLLGGFAYQALALWAGWLLAKWLGPWWTNRRQRRST